MNHILFLYYRYSCYSSIGRKGGEQVVSLGDGCLDRGHAIHEMMHVLGFFHEHSRFDRDKYVKVLWWNIQRGLSCKHYFDCFIRVGTAMVDSLIKFQIQNPYHILQNFDSQKIG